MICDLAEYYHILDYKGLSPRLVASLVCGLCDDSRVKRYLSGQKLTLNQMLNAMMVDALNLLVWSKTTDATHGRNKPKSIFKMLTEEEKTQSFNTPEEFEIYMRELKDGR